MSVCQRNRVSRLVCLLTEDDDFSTFFLKMKTYPRYKVYELFSSQQSLCANCKLEMNVHDMDVENISEDLLFCFTCTETKKKIVSHLDENTSVLDMSLRPVCRILPPSFQEVTINENDFLGKGPIIATPDMSYLSHACIDEELNDLMFERNINELDEDEISEFILKSRAMLGDENRELYDDGEHTDFEEVERYWKEKHDAQDEYEFQLNSDILDF